MKQGNADVQRLRGSTKNSTEIAGLVYASLEWRYVERRIHTACQAVVDWHSHQNKTLRSVNEASTFALAQVEGDWLKPFIEMLKSFSDPSKLEYIGMCFEVDRLRRGSDEVKGAVMEENEGAQEFVEMIFTLIRLRIKRQSYLYRGWPGLRALLLGKEASQERCMKMLRQDVDTHEWLKKQKMAKAKQMLKRTCMQKVCVEQLVECAKDYSWQFLLVIVPCMFLLRFSCPMPPLFPVVI